MADLFISYSREDQGIARRFAEGFEHAGLTVWWDQSLNPGEAFDQVTEQALEEARAVIVLWSKASVSSRWVRAEATQANATGMLVPVMVEPCKRPIMFELTHTADLSHWKGNQDDPAWQAFVAGVQRFVQRRGSGGSAIAPGSPGASAGKPRRSLRERLLAVAATLGSVAQWIGSLLAHNAGRLAFALAGGVIVGLVMWQLRPQLPHDITHFAVDLPGPWNDAESLAISPDGRRIVYVIGRQLYVQRLDQDAPTPIPGAADAGNPFFSPDGNTIAYFTQTQLKAVGFDGEAPRVLANINSGSGLVGSWDAEGRILFGQSGAFGLSRVSAAGGEPVSFAALDKTYGDFDYPSVLPGDKWVMFTAHVGGMSSGTWSNADIVAQNIATGERKVLLHGGHFARYVATGQLLFARGGTLYGVAFDARRLEVRGQPVPVVQGLASNEISGHAAFAVASNGTLAFVPGVAGGGRGKVARAVVRVTRAGATTALPGMLRDYRDPRPSPDGSKIAVEVAGADDSVQIWITNASTGISTQLTIQGEENRFPVWTPDGREVLYVSKRGDTYAIYRQAADGSGAPRHVIDGTADLVPTDVTGRTLIYQDKGANAFRDIFSVELDSTAKPRALLSTPADESGARISPNGRWIAYQSVDISGGSLSSRVYIRPYPDVNAGQRAVADVTAVQPFWSPAGNEILFVSFETNLSLMSVPLVETPTTITPSGRTELVSHMDKFSYALEGTQYAVIVDAMPKGGGFVAVQASESDVPRNGSSDAGRPHINVILNWTEELKKRVPTG
jgi:Tol biopolymer transport system component